MKAIWFGAVSAVALSVAGCVIRYEVRGSDDDVAESTAESTAGSSAGSSAESFGGGSGGSGPLQTGGAGSSASSDTGVPACDPDEVVCGLDCVRLATNPDHCGECDNVCAPDLACDRGDCRDDCRDGKDICARYCVDLEVDAMHCGGCGEACAADEVCVDEACQVDR